MDVTDWLSFAFAVVALAGVLVGGINRIQLRKGIGTQFIRYIAMVLALPIAACLALQDLLTEAAVSVISGALAYAFAGAVRDER